MNIKKSLIYLVGIVNLIVVVVIWLNGSHYYLAAGDPYLFLIALGRLFGLLGELAILTQLVLIGRIAWVEQQFGHDKMNRLHRIIGYSIGFFFVLHPTFLTIGYAHQDNVSLINQFLIFITSWEDVWKALIAFLIFALIISISLPWVRKKIKYEQWYFTHLLVYVAIILVFGHQINTADVSSGAALYYWLVLNFGIGAIYLMYRFIRPWINFFRFKFRIEKVVQETHDVYSVYITGNNLQKFKFKAGQFANYTFLAKGMWYRHPFSFSSAPNGRHIRISVKGVGNFTKNIKNLQPGTYVVIDGPLGTFTEKNAKKNLYLMIAGGIGITPIRSIIESLSQSGKDIVLLYGNKSERDIVFKEELEDFEHTSHMVLSEISDNNYERGFIDEEKIRRLVPDFKNREIYLCGPVSMMNSVTKILDNMGVPDNQIHYERFGY